VWVLFLHFASFLLCSFDQLLSSHLIPVMPSSAFWEFILTAFLAIEQFILYQDQTNVLVCSLQILYHTEKQTKSIDVISLLGMDL
jgi:hypothetical protein